VRNFKYLQPTTVEEAIACLREHGPDAKVIAGGQSLLILMREGLVSPQVLVSIARIASLQGIDCEDRTGRLRLGALVTHAEGARSIVLRTRFPALSAAYHNLGSPQVRNLGTLGGNLVHNAPGSDPPTALIALDALVMTRGVQGTHESPIEEFGTSYYETALGSGELLVEVQVPPMPAGAACVYHKYALRQHDLPFVSVAVRLITDPVTGLCRDVRVALGGVAPTAMRARRAETALLGQIVTDRLVAEAAAVAVEEIDPISDSHASAEYRKQVTPIAVRRALLAARQQEA
jgi:aerobic carbon-monoxide dehydrogenase medium subunit